VEYSASCELSPEQSSGTAATAGDFGFKVLASAAKMLPAEFAIGRLAMQIGWALVVTRTIPTRSSSQQAQHGCVSMLATMRYITPDSVEFQFQFACIPWLTPWWVSRRWYAARDISTPGSPRYVVLDPRGRLEPTFSAACFKL
jgi:hypothetical protein